MVTIKEIGHRGLNAFQANSKFVFYFTNYLRYCLSFFNFGRRQKAIRKQLPKFDLDYIKQRVDYYNKLNVVSELPVNVKSLKDIKLDDSIKTYFFDTYKVVKYFNKKLRLGYLFGDVTTLMKYPTIVKSRPISDRNQNSVLLKLNAVRHFNFVKDYTRFDAKSDRLVWRGAAYDSSPNRKRFVALFAGNLKFNVGQVNPNHEHPLFVKDKLSKYRQFQYKFIACLEGNDVATNLKWVMNSNSVAVMPKPKYETWFMEGRLKPDYHYILIKDDFSDLEDRLNYYRKHPEKTNQIITNANLFSRQFMNKQREKQISILVLEKYFKRTAQL